MILPICDVKGVDRKGWFWSSQGCFLGTDSLHGLAPTAPLGLATGFMLEEEIRYKNKHRVRHSCPYVSYKQADHDLTS